MQNLIIAANSKRGGGLDSAGGLFHASGLSRSAFTLAEVLITLGIIGVVAAMTMPTLIGKYKDREYITRAKKSASTIANALKMMQADYGETNFEYIVSGMNAEQLTDTLAKYFKVIKRCKGNQKGCHDKPIKNSSPRDLDGSGTAGYYRKNGLYGSPQLVLADGSILQIIKYASCNRTYTTNVTDENGNVVVNEDGSIDQVEKYASSCFDITVDTNGIKPPNQIGRDVFGMYIGANGPEKGSRGDLWNILYADQINAVDYVPGSAVKR